MLDQVEKFIAAFRQSLAQGTFVKATLGNYKGNDEHLQKINLRLIETKKGRRIFFLYKFDTRDTAKNYDLDEGLRLIQGALNDGFHGGHLFTTKNDFQLDIGSKGRARLNIAKPTIKSLPKAAHDREKRRLVDPDSLYLRALGITTDQGDIRDKQHDKWRQINKFVETLASFVDKSQLAGRDRIDVVDMGCGKGYLTFAAYDYFKNTRGIDTTVTGVEIRKELVALSNDIAAASDFDGLRFVEGTIDSFDISETDILIALHACDTATDDAIFKGIRARAEIIMTVPCCHKELRPQMSSPAMFKDILKHGVMLERVAETMTDGLRS
ncbi:MAG: SAM-dependent methyltransferase, partial [Acidobacteria bacterium]|nr:SAM-dependent methyltransferase [Acidobacteriota bacterium]